MNVFALGLAFFSAIALAGNLADGFAKGTYKRPKEKIPARGKFLVSELGKGKSFGQGEKVDVIWSNSRIYLINHNAPCDEKTELTVMESGFPDFYFCVSADVLKKNIHEQKEIEYIDILGYVEARRAISEEREAAKKLLLSRDGNLGWWARSKLPPPPGVYFYPSFPHDIRGPFDGVYKEGKLESYRKVNDTGRTEIVPYKNYFISDPTEPCDQKTEHTIRRSGDKYYYCVLKDHFDRMVGVALKTYEPGTGGTRDHVVEGDDVMFAAKESKVAIKSANTRGPRRVSSDFPGRAKDTLYKVDPHQYLTKPESSFLISVYEFKDQTVDGYLVTYHGLLYGLCGGQCRLQGYTVLLDKTGKVVKFLDSTLAQTAAEYDIPPAGLNRILDIANNKNDSLKTLFDGTKTLNSDYVARMSNASVLWGAGNSVGTFQLHLSLVREKLGLTKDWPIFKAWK